MANGLIFPYRLGSDQDTKGERRSERPARDRMCGFKPVGGGPREIQVPIQRQGVMTSPQGHKVALSRLPRKASS